MIELLLRVLCDNLPEMSDGAFLACQTKDNQKSVLIKAHDLFNKKRTLKVFIMSNDAMCGYPGFNVWKHELKKLGIQDNHIEGVIDNSPSINSLIESEALVRHVKLHKLRSIIVVAAPFQQLRAFMTTVTVALREYPDVRIYSCPGGALPWLDTVVHSQGSLRGTRISLIKSELDRIERYQLKGDLATVDDVLNYLNSRDSMSGS